MYCGVLEQIFTLADQAIDMIEKAEEAWNEAGG
jgi:hypothetical protein